MSARRLILLAALAPTPGCLLVDIDLTEPCVRQCDGIQCGPDPVCGKSCGQCGVMCLEGVCIDRRAPEITRLEVTPEVLRPGEDLTVTATAYGVMSEDVLRGELRDAASFSTRALYGTFTRVRANTYTQTVTWERMREVREIGKGRGGEGRTFTVTFATEDAIPNGIDSDSVGFRVDIQCEDPDLAICLGECTVLPEGARTCDG